MIIQRERFEIDSPSGRKLTYDLYLPDISSLSIIDGRYQLMIFAHGFKGFATWGFIPYVCERHSEKGIIACSLNFSMNGIINEAEMTYDGEVFAANTVSMMLTELHLLINHLLESEELKEISDKIDITLAGHSLGAALSLVTAAERYDIKNLVLWGSVGTLDRNTPRQKQLWQEKGIIEFNSKPGGQKLWQNYSYLEDKEKNMDRIDLPKRAAEYKGNLLILHGETDVTTRIKEAEWLYEAAKINGKVELLRMPKTGHTFNSFHPIQSPPPLPVVQATEAQICLITGEARLT